MSIAMPLEPLEPPPTISHATLRHCSASTHPGPPHASGGPPQYASLSYHPPLSVAPPPGHSSIQMYSSRGPRPHPRRPTRGHRQLHIQRRLIVGKRLGAHSRIRRLPRGNAIVTAVGRLALRTACDPIPNRLGRGRMAGRRKLPAYIGRLSIDLRHLLPLRIDFTL